MTTDSLIHNYTHTFKPSSPLLSSHLCTENPHSHKSLLGWIQFSKQADVHVCRSELWAGWQLWEQENQIKGSTNEKRDKVQIHSSYKNVFSSNGQKRYMSTQGLHHSNSNCWQPAHLPSSREKYSFISLWQNKTLFNAFGETPKDLSSFNSFLTFILTF